MKELTIEQLELVTKQMRLCQVQHPKAMVSYDPEKRRINITYPVPKDFDNYAITDIRIIEE